MKRIYLFTNQLKHGMKVADNICNSSGQLIVPKFAKYSDVIQKKLADNNIIEIAVLVEDDFDESSTDNTNDNNAIPISDYNSKIINSQEYKSFVKAYNENLATLTGMLTEIAEKPLKLDKDTLLMLPNSIASVCGNTFSLFDILHNMPSYNDSIFSHSLNVSLICGVFADWLKFSKEDKDALVLSGILHDIGKIKVPESILKKPGKLSAIEFKIIKNHTAYGFNIVKERVDDPRIKAAVLMHHERCDGSGYPSHLTSKQIPQFAKIITIADVYDAMTSSRSYRSALCPFEVIRLFESEGYSKYEPSLIYTFLHNIGQTYINCDVLLSDGRFGKILMLNQSTISKPIVSVDDTFIDLTKNSDIYIKALL